MLCMYSSTLSDLPSLLLSLVLPFARPRILKKIQISLKKCRQPSFTVDFPCLLSFSKHRLEKLMQDFAYVSFHFFQASQPRVWLLSWVVMLWSSFLALILISILFLYFSPSLSPEIRPLSLLSAFHSFCDHYSRVFIWMFSNMLYIYQSAPLWVFWAYLMYSAWKDTPSNLRR